jgi:hypothetical protein
MLSSTSFIFSHFQQSEQLATNLIHLSPASMSIQPIILQPASKLSTFDLLPDEYVRYEYSYKPGCLCFSTKITTITNKRLITQVIKTPGICSRKTSTGSEKTKVIDLKDIHNIEQLRSAIPSSRNPWWMKCIDIFTCRCSNEQIDWLESCYEMDMKASSKGQENVQASGTTEKF